MPTDEPSSSRRDVSNIDQHESLGWTLTDDNMQQNPDSGDNQLRANNALSTSRKSHIGNGRYDTNGQTDNYRATDPYSGYGRYGQVGPMPGYGGAYNNMMGSPYGMGMMGSPYGMGIMGNPYGMGMMGSPYGMGMMAPGIEQRGMMTFMVMSRLAEMSQALTNVVQMMGSSIVQFSGNYIGLSQQYQQMENQTKEIDSLLLEAENSQGKQHLLDDAALISLDEEYLRTGGNSTILTVKERREIVEASRRARNVSAGPSVLSRLFIVVKKMILIGIAIFLAKKIMGRSDNKASFSYGDRIAHHEMSM
eukprot:Tbor_TRINITY_DN3889_c0_g1::TRINITY_DN3889_c0_g1_i3::g.5617::m.5617